MDPLQQLIASYGCWMVGGVVAAESMGIPLPGEATLVLAALYAGTHPDVNIALVIAFAALGAIFGDNAGHWLGREFGYRLLLRYGPAIGLSHEKMKLAMYLFLRHRGKVVFFDRFMAVFRTLAAWLAGANRMPWRTFVVANVAGSVVWASRFGLAAFLFGRELLALSRGLGAVLLIIGIIIITITMHFVQRHETELQANAERTFPGPLPLNPGS
jgi:membrane protein DedA with SNARE-associated domain